MKVSISNLGILKKAEFDVGDLTIICGANNTGKTYATYALYGFLNFWNEAFVPDLLGTEAARKLLNNGSIKVALDEIFNKSRDIINDACTEYINHLPMIFAAPAKYFNTTDFRVTTTGIDFTEIEESIQSPGLNRKTFFHLIKKRGERFITVTVVAKAEDIDKASEEWVVHQINRDILQLLFGKMLPSPFIASIERTGAAIFRKELDFSRNRLLEHVSNREKEIDPYTLISTFYDRGYALPVNADVDFIRNLEDVVKRESIIAESNPDILKDFDSILGGEYRASKDGLYYIPEKSKTKLTMGESASSVRSLLNMGIYIKHLARPGDFLMIDEPELNLHPMNQRLMARILAKLVNASIKIFITTHSDYILKEFNTLIMLNNPNLIARHVMEKYKYQENELLDPERIRAYVAKKALIEIDGSLKRQRHNTFLKAKMSRHGIEIDDFDETINMMNDIQDELLYGG